MTEGTPPMTPEQFRRLNRDLMEKVLDKAASDPEWKQRLLDDPEAAMMEAGFPEVESLREMQASAQLTPEEAEVQGHMAGSMMACWTPGGWAKRTREDRPPE
jgi:hypothetical protein